MLTLSFEAFVLTFIPLLVAIDVVGTIPFYLALTRGMSRVERRATIWQSLVTTAAVSVAFIFIGKFILTVLGITVSDFKIAGGIVLLALAVLDLARTGRPEEELKPSQNLSIGVVPLGTPFLIGPAVLTTILILVDIHGHLMTVLAIVANLLVVALAFLGADQLTRFLGEAGIRALSKIVYLLLAAYAVMMIRLGFQTVLGSG
jgi:multiple antibiotic resistance protein